MSNGIDSAGFRRLVFLSVLVVSATGCDRLSGSADEQTSYRIDAVHQRVWLLSRDGVVIDDVATPKRIRVSLPGWQQVLPPWGCPPDIALGPRGEAVITSNVVPTLWRVDPRTLEVTVHPLALDSDRDKDVGFSRLVYSSREAAFFAVGTFDGSVWKIDAALSSAHKVPAHERAAVALGRRPPCASPYASSPRIVFSR